MIPISDGGIKEVVVQLAFSISKESGAVEESKELENMMAMAHLGNLNKIIM